MLSKAFKYLALCGALLRHLHEEHARAWAVIGVNGCDGDACMRAINQALSAGNDMHVAMLHDHRLGAMAQSSLLKHLQDCKAAPAQPSPHFHDDMQHSLHSCFQHSELSMCISWATQA